MTTQKDVMDFIETACSEVQLNYVGSVKHESSLELPRLNVEVPENDILTIVKFQDDYTSEVEQSLGKIARQYDAVDILEEEDKILVAFVVQMPSY